MWFCRVIQRNHDAQGDKQRVLRAEAQRLAVLFAVVEQIPLIAFQHGPRDLQRLVDAALLAPFAGSTRPACAASATVSSV